MKSMKPSAEKAKGSAKSKPMTMKEFEGTKEDKKVDRKALAKINESRKKK